MYFNTGEPSQGIAECRTPQATSKCYEASAPIKSKRVHQNVKRVTSLKSTIKEV